MKNAPEMNLSREVSRKILSESANKNGCVELCNVGINTTVCTASIDVKKTFYVNAFGVKKDGIDGFLFNNVNNENFHADFYPSSLVIGSKEVIREIPVGDLTDKKFLDETGKRKDYFSNLKEKIASEKERTLEQNFSVRCLVNKNIGRVYDLPDTLAEFMALGKTDQSKMYDTATYIINKYNGFHDEFGAKPLIIVDSAKDEAARIRSTFEQIEMQAIALRHNLSIDFEETNDRAIITVTDGKDTVLSKLFVPVKHSSLSVNFSDGDSFDFTDNLSVSQLDFYDKKTIVVERGTKIEPDESLFFDVYAKLTNYLYSMQWDDLPSLSYATMDGNEIYNQDDRNSLFLTKKLIDDVELMSNIRESIEHLSAASNGSQVRRPSAKDFAVN